MNWMWWLKPTVPLSVMLTHSFLLGQKVLFSYLAFPSLGQCIGKCSAIMKDPDVFIKELTSAPYNYGLKVGGEPNFYLGSSFTRDADGTICWSARQYI